MVVKRRLSQLEREKGWLANFNQRQFVPDILKEYSQSNVAMISS
jgi:hypothetical protein